MNAHPLPYCAVVLCMTSARLDAVPPAAGSGSGPLFTGLPASAAGVKFVHRLDPDHLQNYLYHSGYACGGVSCGDVNGDALPDIFIVSGPDANALFINRGGFRFERTESGMEESGSVWSVSSAMADVDGDGDLDVYVCNYEDSNRLWLNDGKGRFTEAGYPCGLSFIGPSLTSYFADFDRDGDLDLFLLTNRLYSPSGYPREQAWTRDPGGTGRMKAKWAPYLKVVTPPYEIKSDIPFIQEYGHVDRLFRNDGPGPDGKSRFKDVTAASGIADSFGHGLSALIWDVNRDGLPDIYVSNDYIDGDHLWINQGTGRDGQFQFKDRTDEHLPCTSWFSMGSDVADVNNDGRLDFMVADMAATTHFKAKTTMGEMLGLRRWVMENGWPRQIMRNMLFLDSGTGRFTEAAVLAGVAKSDWSWAVKLSDWDLDGRVDVFITNGIARTFSDSDIVVDANIRTGRSDWDIYRNQPEMREANLAFRNDGSLHFTNVAQEWGLDHEGMSYSAAHADFDNDGDLDLVVCNLTENVSLYRNSAADRKDRHWLKVRLAGQSCGAEVEIVSGGAGRQIRLLNPMTGFLSGNEPVVHFGLGADDKVDSVTVRWPSGKVERTGPKKSNAVLLFKEKDAGIPGPAAAPPATLFAEAAKATGLIRRHDEKPFDDYKREFLLPAKQSQFGPGLACADVNGDGLDDIWTGGAAGQPGALFVQQPDHTFRAVTGGPWEAHAAREDMGALFFDADRDGDLDLYVVSGSNEWAPGAPEYGDRLYLNNTPSGVAPSFTDATATLPTRALSGSSVCGADFDRDGDVDFFVGSRSIPGSYPHVAESMLLRNDGTRSGGPALVEIADAVAPGLKQAGIVTSAVWSDVDGDGWQDLLVACEWGPVRIWQNRGGRLEECTQSAGTGTRTGWWSGLSAGDLDGDGDVDYAAANAGYGTKYGHPSADKPLTLYLSDMDGNGTADLVEAKCSAEGELPVRGRSCSSTAMPFIKEKFKSYKLFAGASLTGIYSDKALAGAYKVSADCLGSGVLLNGSTPGSIRLSWLELPPEAQISPGYGMSIVSLGSGRPVLAMAQNLYSREPETGLWRGGIGCLLRLDGTDAWQVLPPNETGFVLPGDSKALISCDLDGNGAADFVVSENNGPLRVFRQRAPGAAVQLRGLPGNPGAAGARITLRRKDGAILFSLTVTAGSGYLSQSAARVHFQPGEAGRADILWPDGSVSSHDLKSGPGIQEISQPGVK